MTPAAGGPGSGTAGAAAAAAPSSGAAPRLDLFLSYQDNPEDRAFAERLLEAVERRGVVAFFAPRDVREGRPWAPQLDEALARAGRVAVVVSRRALASDWVTVERSRTNLIPLLRDLGPDKLPATLAAFPALDFRDEAAFDANVGRLAAAAAPGGAAPAARVEPPRRRRAWPAVALAALVVALLLAGLLYPGGLGALFGRGESSGWWAVEAAAEGERFAPGEPVRLRVRSDHGGYLWIYSPVDGLPNRVFPCPAAAADCETVIAAAGHAIAPGAWRPVPAAGVDRYGVTAGGRAGPDELVVLVTAANDPARALGHLVAMRPELSAKAVALPTGDWGAAVLTIEVGR